MLYPVSVQIPFLAHFTASGTGAAGLTVTITVRRINSDGSITTVTTGSATELADGVYFYLLSAASTGTAGYYVCSFATTGTADLKKIEALEIVGPAWVANVDAAISSRSSHTAADVWAAGTRTLTGFGTLVADVAVAVWAAVTRTLTAGGGASAADVWAYATRLLTGPVTLATGIVTVSSPVASDGTVTLYAGDDYGSTPTNIQRVTFGIAALAAPNLAGGDIAMVVEGVTGVVGEGKVLTSSASGAQIVAVDFTAANTAALYTALAALGTSYTARYTVYATVSGKRQTLAQGVLEVRPVP